MRTRTSCKKVGRLLIVGASIGLAACDGSLAVRGLVHTPDGIPVPAAQVSLHRLALGYGSPVLLGRSNKAGCFILSTMWSPHTRQYMVVVSSPGYKPLLVAIKSNRPNYLSVTLVPEGSLDRSWAQSTVLSFGQEPPDLPCTHSPMDFAD